MNEASRALQRALADACLDAGAADAIADNLPAFLEARGVSPDDIAAIASQPARIGVYRSLVRNALSSVVLRILPRTRARLNRAADGRFDRDFATFVDRVGARTHYLRDVPAEFCAWAVPSWRSDTSLPRYLPDLASFELASLAVGAAVDAPAGEGFAPVSLERALAIHPSARIERLAWRVHELTQDVDSDDEPAAGDVALLAYRDAEHTVRWLELTPLAAAIVERLVAGAALADGVSAACSAMNARFDAKEVAALLGDLAARGVVLGARA
jgi:hypothetical protein